MQHYHMVPFFSFVKAIGSGPTTVEDFGCTAAAVGCTAAAVGCTASAVGCTASVITRA